MPVMTATPVSELFSHLINQIPPTIHAAQNVLVQRDNFAELSRYLTRLAPILTALVAGGGDGGNLVSAAVDIVAMEVKAACALAANCSTRNRVYLLLNSRCIAWRLQATARGIGTALALLPLSSLELYTEAEDLRREMEAANFRPAPSEEEILDRIESGIRQGISDRTYANHLLALIADAAGIPKDWPSLHRELDQLGNEVTEARRRKDLAEAFQMDRIIAMLSKADAAMSFEEKKASYFSRRDALCTTQLIEPLDSFLCPITHDIMEDPVEISSGQTYERSAIEGWLAEGKGNTECSSTMFPLDTEIIGPNIALLELIEEWKESNTMIIIHNLKAKLGSSNKEEMLASLKVLKELCEAKDTHQEWVVFEGFLPVLVGLLSGRDSRNISLSILYILASHSDEIKERIAEVDDAIESVARYLWPRIEYQKLAVALLLELSKNDKILCHIGEVHGCILQLVAISESDGSSAANDARELLKNLSSIDENVIQMAKANYFKPLLQRLSSGSDEVKKIMVTTLAEMELTDHSKGTIFRDGALTPLIDLVSHGDADSKIMAVKAIQNLSSVQQNGLDIIREGAVRPLLNLLQRPNISSPALREQVAATMMNIAISVSALKTNKTITFLESEDDIFWLCSLINMTGCSIQQSILRMFHALCQSPSAKELRAKLRQCSAMQLLIPHCVNTDLVVRANALKLLSCLIDSEHSVSAEYLGRQWLDTLLSIIQTSSDEEERAAAMGIISKLPTGNSEITQWLIDAKAPSTIIRYLTNARQNGSSNQLTENAVVALCHFTTSKNRECQKRAAEEGVIQVLIQLLGCGTPLTKQYACISLAQLSASSRELSKQIERHRGFFCFSPPPEIGCPVHKGICSEKSSFCLLEVDAVQPLLRVLGEPDSKVCEAALMALSTLIEGEGLQISGCKVLADSNGIMPIVRLLSSDSTELQEKTLHVLEKIFQLEEYKRKFGASVSKFLVELIQRGNHPICALAGQILGHLDEIPEQSSYLGT